MSRGPTNSPAEFHSALRGQSSLTSTRRTQTNRDSNPDRRLPPCATETSSRRQKSDNHCSESPTTTSAVVTPDCSGRWPHLRTHQDDRGISTYRFPYRGLQSSTSPR